SRRKGLWLAASFLVRVSLLLGGFYGVSNGHWERLVLCTLGFLVARKVVFRKLVPETARNPAGLKKDAVP
ncbi:MAG: ATP synthase subunit I, partial [Nitrospinaceae bacterium]|nr:ATP synthase subunit I [Nitrospinaceae bacterium]NIR53945.1 ATP synthase subunit I [Nitrospinaceae bacterium]NIS84363.1 ATP synthase subunit I [Nitrospinaceae bacterium]NIT81165.1 ATP synthase subunit I [Nitrospinaceae bacterium]NIU43448.1 ATP synthase subunit I [Nitrospinaceae bacterium]